MTFGLRRPSPRKSIAARLSWRRYVRHSLGLEAPRGSVRTTFSWRQLLRRLLG